MMADPLIIGPVVFLGLKVGRAPMVVKEQAMVQFFIWKVWMQWLLHVRLETELLAVHFQ
jgi:hypothetical protein